MNIRRLCREAAWVLSALLLFAPAALAADGVQYWEVKRGDTLYGIARQLAPGDAVAQRGLRSGIVSLNPRAFEAGDVNRLVVGARLQVPNGRPPPARLQRAGSSPAAEWRVLASVAETIPTDSLRKASAPLVSREDTVSGMGAGRVVAARGRVSALGTDGQRRLLQRRSWVYEGDTLETEAGSRAHVRFRDGGLVSLRPKTRFKIEKYAYEGSENGKEQAFFQLLKGGLRTISGAIGHRNRDRYRMGAAMATIGIRGTHYGLVLCEGGACASQDAGGLADGLYGGVVEGAIAVRTGAGEAVYGTDQFFHLGAGQAMPQLLPEAPDFVFPATPASDRDDGAGPPEKLPSSTLVAQRAPAPAPEPPAAKATPTVTTLTADTPPFQVGDVVGEQGVPVALTTATYEPTGDSTPAGTATIPGTTPAITVTAPAGAMVIGRYMRADLVNVPPRYFPQATVVRSDGSTSNEIKLGTDGAADNLVLGWRGSDPVISGGTFYGGLCDGGQPCKMVTDLATARLAEAGGVAGAGLGINWGRWTGGYTVEEGRAALSTAGDLFYIYSPNITDPSALSAQTGTATFSYMGGPAPMDELGNLYSVDSAFTKVQVDFDGGAGGGEVTAYDLSLSGITADRSWQGYLANGPVALTELVAAQNGVQLQGYCSGGGCAGGTTVTATGDANLYFVGPNAERAMSGFGLYDGNHETGVQGVMALQR